MSIEHAPSLPMSGGGDTEQAAAWESQLRDSMEAMESTDEGRQLLDELRDHIAEHPDVTFREAAHDSTLDMHNRMRQWVGERVDVSEALYERLRQEFIEQARKDTDRSAGTAAAA